MKSYQGSCHCGAIKFFFESEEIGRGLRCNCSICRRKGAMMSEFALSPEQLKIEASQDALGLYQFDSKVAKHFFCKTCGIYPFHETMRQPGHYRINLGCIDEIDTNTFEFSVFDGKSL